jgi:DNA-binding CsgD family transcriptional regulator
LGIGRVCIGIVFEGLPGLPTTVVSVFRDAHEEPFNAADANWMRLLVAHVSRGFGLMQRLNTAKLQHTSMLASFDRLGFGVALLNPSMQMLHLNRAGQAVLDRDDGMALLGNGQLSSTCQGPGEPGLSGWLASLRDTHRQDQTHFLEGCKVMRRTGGHYIVQCAEVLPSSAWAVDDQAIQYIAFIMDPAALQLPSADRLMPLYGLTRSEAKVALAFASGGTYLQVADRLGGTPETVRSHIKEVYPKLRVNRMADMVRVVLSLAHAGA